RGDPCFAPPHIEQPSAHPVAPRNLGNVRLRTSALGQDPRLLRIAPIAPTPPSRDQLDALIRVGIMPGLMHGISARRVVESKRKSRSNERRKRGGGVVPVSLREQENAPLIRWSAHSRPGARRSDGAYQVEADTLHMDTLHMDVA